MAEQILNLSFLHMNGNIVHLPSYNKELVEKFRRDPEFDEIAHIHTPTSRIILKNGVEFTFNEIEEMREKAALKSKESSHTDTKGLRQCKRCGR